MMKLFVQFLIVASTLMHAETVKIVRGFTDNILVNAQSDCVIITGAVWYRSQKGCICKMDTPIFHVVHRKVGCFSVEDIGQGCKYPAKQINSVNDDGIGFTKSYGTDINIMDETMYKLYECDVSVTIWNKTVSNWKNLNVNLDIERQQRQSFIRYKFILNKISTGKTNKKLIYNMVSIKGYLLKIDLSNCGNNVESICFIFKVPGEIIYNEPIPTQTKTTTTTTTTETELPNGTVDLFTNKEKKTSNGKKKNIIIGITCSLLIILVVLIFVTVIIRHKKAKRKRPPQDVANIAYIVCNNRPNVEQDEYTYAITNAEDDFLAKNIKTNTKLNRDDTYHGLKILDNHDGGIHATVR